MQRALSEALQQRGSTGGGKAPGGGLSQVCCAAERSAKHLALCHTPAASVSMVAALGSLSEEEDREQEGGQTCPFITGFCESFSSCGKRRAGSPNNLEHFLPEITSNSVTVSLADIDGVL